MWSASGKGARRGTYDEVVLLSGGIDSACLLAERATSGVKPEALFVDYGQPPAAAERVASHALARHFGSPWGEVKLAGIDLPQGEIPGRNALLVHIALTWMGRRGAASIYLGLHAGVPYRDCSPQFVSETQRSLDLQSGGAVRLVAPFIAWSKQMVVERALELDVPLELTRSCERTEEPCGKCLSCLDRKQLLARA